MALNYIDLISKWQLFTNFVQVVHNFFLSWAAMGSWGCTEDSGFELKNIVLIHNVQLTVNILHENPLLKDNETYALLIFTFLVDRWKVNRYGLCIRSAVTACMHK